MADNVTITAGSGTTIAADEVTRNATSEKQQIVKIGLGIDGVHDGLVAATTPMPVGGSTSATLGKAEDAAHASADVGAFVLGIRRDSAVALTDTNGDYTGFAATQYGAQQVCIDSGFQLAAATSILKLEDAGHSSGDAGVMALGVRNDSDAALSGTDLDYTPIATDSAGRVKISPGTTAGSLGKAEDGAHTSADVGVMSLGVRQDTAANSTSATGDYSFMAVNGFGATLIDLDRSWQKSAANGILKAEDAAHASGDAGVMALGVRNDANAPLSGADLDYTPFATDSAGRVKVLVEPASAANGASTYRNINLAATGQSIKGSAGQVYGWYFFNASGATLFVKLYNTAAAPTVGTDVPVETIAVKAGEGIPFSIDGGIAFSAGIGIGCTTGVADNNAGAPGANEMIVNVFYK